MGLLPLQKQETTSGNEKYQCTANNQSFINPTVFKKVWQPSRDIEKQKDKQGNIESIDYVKGNNDTENNSSLKQQKKSNNKIDQFKEVLKTKEKEIEILERLVETNNRIIKQLREEKDCLREEIM